MKEKVGMDRFYIGYFVRIRFVDSDRSRRVFFKREYKKMKDLFIREEFDRYKFNID